VEALEVLVEALEPLEPLEVLVEALEPLEPLEPLVAPLVEPLEVLEPLVEPLEAAMRTAIRTALQALALSVLLTPLRYQGKGVRAANLLAGRVPGEPLLVAGGLVGGPAKGPAGTHDADRGAGISRAPFTLSFIRP